PRGYIAWLRTWVDDERYVSPFEDGLNQYRIDVAALPQKAFDSEDERRRVSELLDEYNNPVNDSNADEEPSGSVESDKEKALEADSEEKPSATKPVQEKSTEGQAAEPPAPEAPSIQASSAEVTSSEATASEPRMTPEIDRGFG